MGVANDLRITLEELKLQDEEIKNTTLKQLEYESNKGSEEHMLLLGKYFLDKSNSEAEGISAKIGVAWLIKASKQGNEEASVHLQVCLENQQGITEGNLPEVVWCVNTPALERRARDAARNLYKKIKDLSGNSDNPPNIMTREEFNSGIELLGNDKKEVKLLEKVGKLDKNSTITEEYFIERVVKKLQGRGGFTLESITQKDVEWEAYLSSSAIQKFTKYPGKTLAWIADYTVETAGSRGMYWLKSLVPTHQIYMLIVFFIYSLISFKFVLWLTPLVVFYLSFLTLLVCTMQMFYSKRKLKDVKAIAEMLNKFQNTLDSEGVTSAFTWNSLTPYVTFLIALIFTILSFTVADKAWIPCAEIVCIAGIFTITCFFALSDEFEFLAVLSISLDNVSTLPIIIEGLPRIPVVYHVINFFAGHIFSLEVVPGLHLNFGFPSLAYIIVPILFVRMAMRHSWKGVYKVLIPHLVCFFWWRIAIMFYRHTTWLGLVRASFGWVVFVALLPVLTLVGLFGGIFYLLNFLTITNAIKLATTIVLLGIPATFAYWAQKGFKIKGVRLSESKSKTAKFIMIILFVVSVIPVLFVMIPRERKISSPYITWDQYKQVCSEPHWKIKNIASAMMSCSHLQGAMVDWTGSVKKIVVKKVENEAEGFINKLPIGVGNWLRCVYGEEYPQCDTIMNLDDRHICQLNTMQHRTCHLKSLNRYTFELWIQMPLSDQTFHDIRIEASHWFGETLNNISQHDQVQVHAMLNSEIGNVWPVLKLYMVKCDSCEGDVAYGGADVLSETWNIFYPCVSAMQNVWNFFMSPIIEFVF